MKKNILDKKIWGLLISIIFIVFIFSKVDIGKTLESFSRINPLYFLIIIPVYWFSFLFRAYRWQLILSNNKMLEIKSLISALFIGYMANSFLPARMGEIYRAHLLGKKENIGRFKVFASIILERIFDGLILFLIVFTFVVLLFSKSWLCKLAFISGLIFIGGFLFLLAFAKAEKLNKINFSLIEKNVREKFILKLPFVFQEKTEFLFNKISYYSRSFIEGLDIFHCFDSLVKSLFFSLIIWFIEACVVFLVISSFGVSTSPLLAFFVLGVTTLSTMIPSGPASIGPYQYGYILAFEILSINKETALAVSIVNQLIVVFCVSTAGLFFTIKDRINIKELEEKTQIQ